VLRAASYHAARSTVLWPFSRSAAFSWAITCACHPRVWQSLDVVSGCVMLGMAGVLYASQLV